VELMTPPGARVEKSGPILFHRAAGRTAIANVSSPAFSESVLLA
jgi:hypothetical protein